MPLEDALRQSHQWMRASLSLIDGLSFEATDRARVAVSLLHLCMEHQAGIYTLVAHNVEGSAFALLRPQFEAYVRGIWYHRCATNEQVAKFVGGAEPPKIAALVEAIEKVPGLSDGELSKIKAGVWREFNDFTHGGSIQVKSRNSPSGIGAQWLHEHIVGLLEVSVVLAKLGGVGIASILENETLAVRFQNLYRELYGNAA
jgi:hypothetical protein